MGKTILVVDDKKNIRDLLEFFLTESGYKTILCEDGQYAVPHINQADLLITDFNMPKMNGVELAKIAKREKPNMPVIIMTGNSWEVPAAHLADRIINKPFDVGQLKKVIADLLSDNIS